MSATDLVPTSDHGALEADPVQYMAVVLNRAKSWLEEAQSIESVRDAKAVAVGYESVIREKELAFDAQLSATEIVRRCERRIGELVREGQRAGTMPVPGQHITPGIHRYQEPSRELFGSPKARSEAYAMTDVPAEQFEQAISTAREEGNLSRANVVRKVKGAEQDRPPKRKPAPASLDTERGRRQAASHARRFTDLVAGLNGYADGITTLDIALIRAAIDPAELDEWTRSLRTSLTKLSRFRTDLQEGRN